MGVFFVVVHNFFFSFPLVSTSFIKQPDNVLALFCIKASEVKPEDNLPTYWYN